MTYTNEQLKQTLAKMLPERVHYATSSLYGDVLAWTEVLDTELLHLCWEIEGALTLAQLTDFGCKLACLIMPPKHTATPHWGQLAHATWQQRTVTLAQTLGIEIV